MFYPILTADALLSLAHQQLYAAKWTRKIESEWMTALTADCPDLAGKIEGRRDESRNAIPDWEVEQAAWEPLAPGLVLPDLNDTHVLAAAVAGHCDCIVTANVRHFPTENLARFNVEAIHPDDFILAQLDLDPIAALTALKAMRLRRKKPAYEPAQFAERFAANGLVRTAERLHEAKDLI